MHIQQDDDFDPSKILKRLAAHIEQPEKFAQIFCDAAKSQKAIDNHLKEVIKEVLIKDPEMISYLKQIARDVDKEDWRFCLKKIGLAGWAGIVFAAGAVFTALIHKLII